MNRTTLAGALWLLAVLHAGAANANTDAVPCDQKILVGEAGLYVLQRTALSRPATVTYVERNGVPGPQTGGLDLTGSTRDACGDASGSHDQLVACGDWVHCEQR